MALMVRPGLTAALLLLAAVAPARAAAPGFKKALVIVLENTDYEEAVTRPFFRKLAARGAALADYHAIDHPSQPNYIALIAGDTLDVQGDGPVDLDARQLGDLLAARGLSWAVYAEGYPGDCFLGSRSGKYARKHVPFLSFRSVQKSPALCARVKDAGALDADAAAGALPAFSLYVPDLDDDGHDTDVDAADAWLAGFLGPRLDDPKFMKDLLVVVTFDEDSGTRDNHILTLLAGAGVRPGASSGARYDHYSLLRTLEDAWGLGDLGRNDAKAAPIAGVWGAP